MSRPVPFSRATRGTSPTRSITSVVLANLAQFVAEQRTRSSAPSSSVTHLDPPQCIANASSIRSQLPHPHFHQPHFHSHQPHFHSHFPPTPIPVVSRSNAVDTSLGYQQPQCFLGEAQQLARPLDAGNTIELRMAKYKEIRDAAVRRTKECIQRSKEYNAMVERRWAEDAWQAPRVSNKKGCSIADGISDYFRGVDQDRHDRARMEEERWFAERREELRRGIGRPEPNSQKAPYFPVPSIVPVSDVSPCCDVTHSFAPSRRTRTAVPLETDDHRYAHMKSWLGTVNNPDHREGSLAHSHSVYTPSVSTQSLTGSAQSFNDRHERRARVIRYNNVELKAQQRVLDSWQELQKNRETALRLLNRRYTQLGIEWSFTELHPGFEFPDQELVDLIHPFVNAADYVRHRLTTVKGMTLATFSIALPEPLARQDGELIDWFKFTHARLDKLRASRCNNVARVNVPQPRSEDVVTVIPATSTIVTHSDDASEQVSLRTEVVVDASVAKLGSNPTTIVETDHDDSNDDAFFSFDSSIVACVEPVILKEDTTTITSNSTSSITDRFTNLAGSLVQAGWRCLSGAFTWVKDRVWR